MKQYYGVFSEMYISVLFLDFSIDFIVIIIATGGLILLLNFSSSVEGTP